MGFSYILPTLTSDQVYMSMPYTSSEIVWQTFSGTSDPGNPTCGGNLLQTYPNYCLKIQDTNIKCIANVSTAYAAAA